MAERTRGGTEKRKDEKKKRKLNLPKGPSLIIEEEVSESISPLRTTRGTKDSVSVAALGISEPIAQAIPLRPGAQSSTGVPYTNVEIVDSDKDILRDTPRHRPARDEAISPPNRYLNPPHQASGSGTKPINPDTGVEYLCAHGKDLLRSGETSGYGKMSNVDRIRHGQANLLQAIGNLLHMEGRYEDAKRKYDGARKEKDDAEDKLRESVAALESQKSKVGEISSAYVKAKGICREKHSKICDYRERLKRANKSIRGMKEGLGENAVNAFVNSEDFLDIQEKTFDSAVRDVRTLLLRAYPDFDFAAFNADVDKAIESRVREPCNPVADISENYQEEPISEEEPEAVSSDDDRFLSEPTIGKARRSRRG